MWSRTFRKIYPDVTAEQIWSVWTDVNNWHVWQDDIDYARLSGDFIAGNVIAFRPKGGPDISIIITAVSPGLSFVDRTTFPLAKMDDRHELQPVPDGVEIVSTITVRGLLTFLWVKLVADGIVKGLEQQTDRLVQRARDLSQ